MNGAICVDASVAVKWLLPERESDKALALLNDALTSGANLLGPPHLPIEVTSAIYKRLRQGEITLEEAHERMQVFSTIPIDLVFPAGLTEKALDLATEFDWTYPYDAFYLAVAELIDCDVWTADEEFLGDASTTYPRVRPIADYS